MRRLNRYFAVVALFLIGCAHAPTAPSRATLEYAAPATTWPRVTLKAAGGSAAYIVFFRPDKDANQNLTGIDLIVHRPGSSPDAPNVLESPYYNHGILDFNFVASDLARGPENSVVGATRKFHIRDGKVDVTATVSKARVRPADKPLWPNAQVIEELVVEVDVQEAG